MAAAAKNRLMSELKSLQQEKWLNIEVSEHGLFNWVIGMIILNSDSVFHGAYFKCEMAFTDNYPMSPPAFKFLRPIYHPNIYADGKVCISILHAPGEDEQSGELASERWSSVQSVESVLRSILLMLDDPEISSPANVDAGILYRDSREAYNAKARNTVQESLKDVPEGFDLEATFVEAAPEPKSAADDDDFWNESGEDDFGGSDSSGDDMEMEDDADEQEESEVDQPEEKEL